MFLNTDCSSCGLLVIVIVIRLQHSIRAVFICEDYHDVQNFCGSQSLFSAIIQKPMGEKILLGLKPMGGKKPIGFETNGGKNSIGFETNGGKNPIGLETNGGKIHIGFETNRGEKSYWV